MARSNEVLFSMIEVPYPFGSASKKIGIFNDKKMRKACSHAVG